MTYNFDPDRWYDIQRALIDGKLARDELDEKAHRAALIELDEKYDRMLERLDNTYRIPDSSEEDQP